MDYTNLTGPLTISMTNDYLFRALLQQNNKVLRGLIGSLLHFPLKEIITVEITNPIELGTAINEKTFFLDIKVLLNQNTTINLEMQVINEHNWPERSLSYLCRSFDSLNRGEDYLIIRPIIQISLLNFTLFPDYPEFYATYQLLNIKKYIKYSDKLRLHVLDLTHVDLATEEDRWYQIDYWALFFKATTWEELKMLAEKSEFIAEAAETIYKLSAEEKIRLQCEAREEYYRVKRTEERLKEINEQKRIRLEHEKEELEQKKEILRMENETLEQKNETLEQQVRKLASDNKRMGRQIKELTYELERLRGVNL